MKTKSFFASLVAAFAALACQPSDPAFEPSLEVSGIEQGTATVPAAATTLSFTVKSNLSYTIVSDKDWATPNPASVDNTDKKELTTSVAIAIEANTAEEAREATVKVITDGYSSLDYTFTVRQSAAVHEKSMQVLTSDLSSPAGTINVDATNASASVMVLSTVSWTATSNAEWLAADPASVTVENFEETPTAVSFRIADNTTTEAREATVTFVGEGVEPVVVTVKQDVDIPFEATVELMSVSDFNPNYLQQYPDETSLGVILGYSSVPVVSGYYGLWTSDLWSTEISDWDSYTDQIMEDVKIYGKAMEDNMISSINGANKYFGTIYYNLESDKEYILIAIFEDEKGRTYLDYSICKTKAVNYDDYTGFLKIGNYSMTCIDGGGNTNSATFTVSPAEEENQFTVKTPFGVNDKSVWYAVFDPEANTLTLDGTEVGYENYGNQFGFGIIYGWWNQANMYAYGYLSFSESMDDEDGDAPIVFSVNEDGYVSALKNYVIGCYVYKVDSGFNVTDELGWGTIFIRETTTIASAATSSNSKLSKKEVISTESILNGKRQMVDLARPVNNLIKLR